MAAPLQELYFANDVLHTSELVIIYKNQTSRGLLVEAYF